MAEARDTFLVRVAETLAFNGARVETSKRCWEMSLCHFRSKYVSVPVKHYTFHNYLRFIVRSVFFGGGPSRSYERGSVPQTARHLTPVSLCDGQLRRRVELTARVVTRYTASALVTLTTDTD